MLLFIIDGTIDEDGRSPAHDYQVLLNEIKEYSDGALLSKPFLIVQSCFYPY